MTDTASSWEEQLQSALNSSSLSEAKECFSLDELTRIEQQDLAVEALCRAYSANTGDLSLQVALWLDDRTEI